MTLNSIVGIDTVKFCLLGNEGTFLLPDTTSVNVVSPYGEIVDTYQNRKCLAGQFEVHNLHLRALHGGQELSVEGSPYAYWYGQNLFTSNDLHDILCNVLPDVLKQCVNQPSESDILRWRAGDILVKRIDLYVNFPCPVGVTPKRLIRQIARQLIERGVATRTHGSSFAWAPDGGRQYEIVFYAKGPQMRAKRSLAKFPNRTRLLREAENIVRIELRLQSEMLRELTKLFNLDLEKASAWTPEITRKIFGHFMKKLRILNVTVGPLSDEELAALPSSRLKPVLALHKAGYDLNQIYSPATVQRHMRTFRNLGIDLRCPNQPQCEALPLLQLLKPSTAIRRAPAWMRKLGYAPPVR